jgi:hypothetical protein
MWGALLRLAPAVLGRGAAAEAGAAASTGSRIASVAQQGMHTAVSAAQHLQPAHSVSSEPAQSSGGPIGSA